MAAPTKHPRGIDLLVRPERMEASLWRSYIAKPSQDIRQELFDYYQPVASRIAAKHYHKRKTGSCELHDVEQLAYEGLLHSIDRFDPERGVPFSAFCRRRISGNISTGLEATSERSSQYSYRRRVERERMASLAAKAEADEDPVSALSRLAALLAIGLMLEGEETVNPDTLATSDPNAYESLAWREMQNNLHDTISQLDKRDSYVIVQHYMKGISFAQIAEILGVTPGRISQIHRAGLMKLRELMKRYR